MPARGSRLRLLRQRHARTAFALGLGLLAAGVIVGVRALGWLEPLELDAFDTLLHLTRPTDAEDPRVVLIGISEADIRDYGHPLSDERLTRALAILSAGRPRAIGVDLYRDQPVPPGESGLEEFVLRHPDVVFIEALGEASAVVPPPPYVVGTSQVGFSDVKADADGRLRRGLLAMSGQGMGGLSLSTRLAIRYLVGDGILPTWSADPGDPLPVLHLGGSPLRRFHASDGGYQGADDGGYQVLLGYPRGRSSHPRYSLGQVFRGEVPPQVIRERIVVLGSTAASVRDEHDTPFGTAFGIEHHAQVVGQLLDAALGEISSPRVIDDPLEVAGIGGAALGAAGAALIGSALGFSFLWLGGLAAIGLGGLFAFEAGWWLPIVPTGLAWVTSGGLVLGWASFTERAERRRVMDLFGRFLARDVAEAVWRERDAFMDGGRPAARRAALTVLMADLQGYTAAAEKLDPPELMVWISSYLDAMARVVGCHGGVVDDYAGDGVKANFGVPIPRTTEREIAADARAAADSALAMKDEMESLNREWATAGLPAGRLRVGIHSGEAVVGMIGSADRLKYTSVGDLVNTAARLESYERDAFSREPGAQVARILVSSATSQLLGDGYTMEPLGAVALRGKDDPVSVFRLLGRFISGESRS